MLNSSSSDYW